MIIDLAMVIKLDGLVATNTTISREGLTTSGSRIKAIGAGGLSGLPVKQRVLKLYVISIKKQTDRYLSLHQEEFLQVLIYLTAFKSGIFDCLVADVNGQVAGLAIYYQAFSTWKGKMYYLEDFVVAEAYRRYGIGQLLFDAFLADARKRDTVMVKWQVLDWNEPALRFYEKKKAIIEKEWWNGKIWF